MPPTIVRAIERKYRSTGSPSTVEYVEYAGRTHRLVSQDGWEEIADHALAWAVGHATASVT